VPIDTTPPNLREEMCGAKHKRPASDEDGEDTVASAGTSTNGDSGVSFFASGLQAAMPTKPADLLAQPAAASEPVVVYTGPTKTGAALIAAVEADTEKLQPAKRAKGKHTRVAGKKSDAPDDAKGDSKSASKSDSKPAAKPVRHANAKPDAAAAKPAADKPTAARPAGKPSAAAKPAAKPKTEKPKAEKPKADAKPAG
jgi:D-alanyl-D-alanine carboxypeptidase